VNILPQNPAPPVPLDEQDLLELTLSPFSLGKSLVLARNYCEVIGCGNIQDIDAIQMALHRLLMGCVLAGVFKIIDCNM